MVILWYYLLSIVVIGIDQLTKYLVAEHMEIGESIEVISGFLYLTSHRNAGAAFGILQGQMWLFFIVTVIVIIAVIYHLHKYANDSGVTGISLALILGGAIGNFIDRLMFGEVVDFFDVYIFSYNYPIFNIADSALVAGVILLIMKMIRDEWKEKRKKA
ncbi:signal peptidase II Aspartic peptidase. MEROPS family A08 [Alteribacillus persepolensis]|uniref:Lipoprotein signal peptidase n=1 Tax=Alteribacillus persepolensis TaxID=568899 RepID=A0A1G7YGR9_9BACI|nr:signal peptidase II [Alteribacillus persepolensis]SDG95711.1 signal peptidase II Aspartic peptidase. MEROPS family A08 [Alteribacillus persepolensis]